MKAWLLGPSIWQMPSRPVLGDLLWADGEQSLVCTCSQQKLEPWMSLGGEVGLWRFPSQKFISIWSYPTIYLHSCLKEKKISLLGSSSFFFFFNLSSLVYFKFVFFYYYCGSPYYFKNLISVRCFALSRCFHIWGSIWSWQYHHDIDKEDIVLIL